MNITSLLRPETAAIIGNINVDIKTSLLAASDAIFSDGETSVASIRETFGGGAANVAVAANRLGGHIHLCACIGQDWMGERLSSSLAEFGVTAHLARKPAATGHSINLNWDHHHRHFISSLPSAAMLASDDIDLAALDREGCRHLYRGDIWFSDTMLHSGNVPLMRDARQRGMETYLDINWDPSWAKTTPPSTNPERIQAAAAMLPYTSYVHANERELSLFTSINDPKEAAQALIDQGVGAVIVHRGKAGSAALTPTGEWIEQMACPVSRIVCETGTGDVFSAAFLLCHHLPLRERLAACNWIAAQHLQGALDLISAI